VDERSERSKRGEIWAKDEAEADKMVYAAAGEEAQYRGNWTMYEGKDSG
jgi:hypothetical protein